MPRQYKADDGKWTDRTLDKIKNDYREAFLQEVRRLKATASEDTAELPDASGASPPTRKRFAPNGSQIASASKGGPSASSGTGTSSPWMAQEFDDGGIGQADH